VRSSTVPKNFMNGCLSSPGGRNAHAAAKSWHRGVIRRVIHVDGALVTAVLACHEQATDAASHVPSVIGRVGPSSPTPASR
jgi:hypothetical protein